jgi:hypothetical protein
MTTILSANAVSAPSMGFNSIFEDDSSGRDGQLIMRQRAMRDLLLLVTGCMKRRAQNVGGRGERELTCAMKQQ